MRIARPQNSRARASIQREEHSHTHPKGILRCCIFFTEFAEPTQEFRFALGSQGMDVARLPALSFARFLLDPTGFQEFTQERIDKIVVQVRLSGEPPGALL